jgi:hypothetical protein
MFFKQIAFFKSTNTKILLNIHRNSPKCGQTCTCRPVPPTESVNDDGGGKMEAVAMAEKLVLVGQVGDRRAQTT